MMSQGRKAQYALPIGREAGDLRSEMLTILRASSVPMSVREMREGVKLHSDYDKFVRAQVAILRRDGFITEGPKRKLINKNTFVITWRIKGSDEHSIHTI